MAVTILITRPEDAALAFADQVRARLGCGVRVVISPLMEMVYLSDIPPLDNIRTLIFTSVHAVRAFARATERRDFECYTVGDTTAHAAREAGFDPVPGGGSADALAQRVIGDRPDGECLYLRGDHIAFGMKKALTSAGIETKEAVLYRQEDRNLSREAQDLLMQDSPVVLPLFSPRSASLFFGQARLTAPLYVAVISPNVANEVPADQVHQLEIASGPSAGAMITVIETLCIAANQLEGKHPPQ